MGRSSTDMTQNFGVGSTIASATSDGRYVVNSTVGIQADFIGLNRAGDGNAANNQIEFTAIRGYPWLRSTVTAYSGNDITSPTGGSSITLNGFTGGNFVTAGSTPTTIGDGSADPYILMILD